MVPTAGTPMATDAIGIGIFGFGGFAMLADRLAFIAEPSHPRVITEDNGRESLRVSVRATQLVAAS